MLLSVVAVSYTHLDVYKRQLTTTDIAVRAGMASIGDSSRVSHLDEGFVQQVLGLSLIHI